MAGLRLLAPWRQARVAASWRRRWRQHVRALFVCARAALRAPYAFLKNGERVAAGVTAAAYIVCSTVTASSFAATASPQITRQHNAIMAARAPWLVCRQRASLRVARARPLRWRAPLLAARARRTASSQRALWLRADDVFF